MLAALREEPRAPKTHSSKPNALGLEELLVELVGFAQILELELAGRVRPHEALALVGRGPR